MDDIPKARRNRKSAIRDSEEFQQLQARVNNHGLKPGEALQISLPESLTKKVMHAHRLFKNETEKYLQSLNLAYKVFVRRNEDGIRMIYVSPGPGR